MILIYSIISIFIYEAAVIIELGGDLQAICPAALHSQTDPLITHIYYPCAFSVDVFQILCTRWPERDSLRPRGNGSINEYMSGVQGFKMCVFT